MHCSACIALHALLLCAANPGSHLDATRYGTCIALHTLHAQGELKTEEAEQGEETGAAPSDPLKTLRKEVQDSCAEFRCMHSVLIDFPTFTPLS